MIDAMDRLHELRDSQHADMLGLVEAAEADGRDMTEDEAATYETLRSEVEAVDRRIKRLNEVRAACTPPSTRVTERPQIVKPPTPGETGDRGGQAVAVRDIVIPSSVRRRKKLRAFTPELFGDAHQKHAYRMGMFGLAALGNERARDWMADHGMCMVRDQEKRVHTGNVNWQGGVFVPDEIDNDFIVLRETYGIARQVFRNVQMSSDVKSRRQWDSGLTAYYVGEGDSITESTTGSSMVNLVAVKLAAIATVSSELDEDSVIEMGDFLGREMAYAFATKEDAAAFLGDGTSTYGGITGILPRLTAATAGLITQGTGTTWGAIVLGDFNDGACHRKELTGQSLAEFLNQAQGILLALMGHV